MKSTIKEIKDINIQASIAMYKNTHRMLSRNKQSYKIQRKQASIIIIKIRITNNIDSENTNYKDSLLIKLFYTQLVF